MLETEVIKELKRRIMIRAGVVKPKFMCPVHTEAK